MTNISPQSDPLVVRAEDFKPFLEQYLREYEREVDLFGNELEQTGYPGEVPRAGAIDVLSKEAGIDPRRIFAFRHGETKSITYRVFDKLIQAMGMPQWAAQIPVYRNPRWSVPKFVAWLNEQGLTPEDINVELTMPEAGEAQPA